MEHRTHLKDSCNDCFIKVASLVQFPYGFTMKFAGPQASFHHVLTEINEAFCFLCL